MNNARIAPRPFQTGPRMVAHPTMTRRPFAEPCQVERVELIDGFRLLIRIAPGDCQVWLQHDGGADIALGVGETRDAALRDVLPVLEHAIQSVLGGLATPGGVH